MAFPSSKRSTKSQTQFLFVHHDSTTLDNRVSTKKVNAHVQVLYRRRKRGVNEKWQPNMEIRATQMKLKLKDGVFVVHGRGRRKKSEKNGLITAQQSGVGMPGLVRAATIRKGNSDPFSVMPIKVEPIINMILTWHRSKGIPALNPVESTILESPTPSAQRIWAHTVLSMQNPDLVYPYLASVCALMVRRTEHNHLSSVCLQLKDQGYIVLRRKLLGADASANSVTRNMILSMFWAELATGKPSAAKIHLKMLDWMVRSPTLCIETIPRECRLKFLTADTNLAVWQMTMPITDVRDTSVERYFEDWKTMLSWEMNEIILLKEVGVHASITDQELRTVFMRLRELVAVSELVANGSVREGSVFQWMDARLLSCESYLVSICLNRHPGTVDVCYLPTRNKSWRMYCTALAALAWIASTWASSNRGIGPTMARRLKQAIVASGLLSISAGVHQDLICWIFYAGTALECRDPEFNPSNAWFSSYLQTQVNRMGLAQATETLKRFLYSEGVCPLNLAWQAP